jgi:hypothetical protein
MSEKSPEELYAERVKRVLDVAALRVPDRVPVFGPYQLYPYTFAGVFPTPLPGYRSRMP